uniref:Peptidyl-prolyl cis-trans isomerase n=1 Tax=uncultured Thiotrichaceae bacterium TaxID=298394 RepID=A0A6S6U505_9GAMM|nr:MAG: FKBP-type peptidyl-prolyl cis-trans isomerase SlyD (EC [uncultured Thiotrichaceae bacterium]
MQIAQNSVASLRYVLTDTKGEILDEATTEAPFVYLHGANNIIAGLETALVGKTTNDQLEVTIPPEDAYGLHDEHMTQQVTRDMFGDVEPSQLLPGVQFNAQTNVGDQIVTITEVDGDNITIDGNHPLAGETLHFDVTVLAVREATEEELKHGHAHDDHGDCGH